MSDLRSSINALKLWARRDLQSVVAEADCGKLSTILSQHTQAYRNLQHEENLAWASIAFNDQVKCVSKHRISPSMTFRGKTIHYLHNV